jgi:transcriptional regulator with XRE-family HTH domain
MFSTRLRNLRRDKGVTQQDIANLVGITYQGVGKWERGITTPDFDALVKLSDYFHVSLDYLITGEEQHKPCLSQDEERLVELFRFTDDFGRGTILESAEREAKRVAFSTGKVLRVAT